MESHGDGRNDVGGGVCNVKRVKQRMMEVVVG